MFLKNKNLYQDIKYTLIEYHYHLLHYFYHVEILLLLPLELSYCISLLPAIKSSPVIKICSRLDGNTRNQSQWDKTNGYCYSDHCLGHPQEKLAILPSQEGLHPFILPMKTKDPTSCISIGFPGCLIPIYEMGPEDERKKLYPPQTWNFLLNKRILESFRYHLF